MVSEAPPFWWSKPGLRALALMPASWIYGRVAARRMDRSAPARAAVPVICVGNFTVGGAGKTPTALTLGRAALDRGMKPGFLSRGYGGSLGGVVVVDPQMHRARDVGDEPLLLARLATTVTASSRAAGAEKLVAEGVDIIIMDDGFQSRGLAYDYALLVIDSVRGLGNGRVIPGGPVRAPVVSQLRHASALLTIGDGDAASKIVRLAARAAKPVYEAVISPRPTIYPAGTSVLAYAGIGDPDKFFRTVEQAGLRIAEFRRFPDHHTFTDDEIDDLLDYAEVYGLKLVTTAKDHVRLSSSHGRSAELAEQSLVLDVDLHFDEGSVPDAIIDQAIAAFKRQKLAG